jgi:hypothetical protein
MAIGKMVRKLMGKGKSAETRTKEFSDLPGYDEGTRAAQKEVDDEIALLKKKQQSSSLTAREEKRLSAMENRRNQYREAYSDKPAKKVKPLSGREKKDMQESLEFKKGGAVMKKKYAVGGAATKGFEKAAEKSGRTMPTTGKPATKGKPAVTGLAKAAAMSGRTMPTPGKAKMNVGGMAAGKKPIRLMPSEAGAGLEKATTAGGQPRVGMYKGGATAKKKVKK